MAFTDSPFPRTDEHTENVQDVIPASERNQDPAITDMTHGLTAEGARPLTEEERKAADREAPAGHTVYAPASERVPVQPMPGHREFVEHTDTHTAEREAAASNPTGSAEPSFTRVARPSVTPNAYASGTGSPGWDASNYGSSSWDNGTGNGRKWFGLSIGWAMLGMCGAAGVWLWLRWQRERNKPLNRLRRQARHAAEEIRERVPTPEEAARPAMGLTTAILSILLMWWQQSQARTRQADKVVSRQAEKASKRANKTVSRASDAIADVDWQKRLTKLKDRWSPGRLELEKISISRH